MKKDIKKLLFFIGVYAISSAFITNYQELWMAGNNLSTKTISVVYSLCALLTVSVIFLCSNLVTTKNMKNFIKSLVFLRILTIISLFILNNTGLNILIKFIVMLDYVVDIEINTSFYPLLAMVTKDDELYAKKDLVYNTFYYIAVLISLLFLRKHIIFINFSYNTYLLIASLLMLLSYICLWQFNPKEKKKNTNQNNTFSAVVKEIKSDKVLILYFIFIIFNQLSYNAIAGITITLLTSGLSLTEKSAIIMNTFAGFLASIIGIAALKLFTFKSEKVNLFIKYGIRVILYALAFIFKFKWLYLASILYTILSSVAYSHITDAPYVNRLDESLQFSFCNLKSMITYAGKALGTLFCGIAIGIGVKYVFLFGALFGLLLLVFIYKAIDIRKEETNDR